MGFEYEILKEFANELGVELEIKIVNNLDDLIPMLNNGEGDIIACNYTITRERKKQIDFSLPYIRTPQV
jgi:membrane-bound lytic murein transglycosylase F